MTYIAYTDGACGQNGSWQGGYGWVVLKDDEILYEGCGHLDNTTNNICEMTGMLQACRKCYDFIQPDDCVIIYSDSAYLVNGLNSWVHNWRRNGWQTSKKQPVLNQELWQALLPFVDDDRFTFEKVKAHATNKWNNFVDQLAVAAKGE